MPITVYYNNNTEHPCTIRPTPLISVNSEILKTGAGEAFGVTYQITLNGKLIANQGTPYAFKTNDENTPFDFFAGNAPTSYCGPYCAFDNGILHQRPTPQVIGDTVALGAILSKQKAIRALFAMDGQRVEITDWAGLDPTAQETAHNPVLIFYPRITNVSFGEGIYVDTCDYTITMEADILLNDINSQGDPKDFIVDGDATLLMSPSGSYNTSGIYGVEKLIEDGYEVDSTCGDVADLYKVENAITERILSDYNYSFISDFTENWSIEADEQFGENFGDVELYSNEEDTPFRDLIQPRSYVITHTISAVGKTHYGPEGKSEAWKEARNFVQNRLVHADTSEKELGKSYPNVPIGPDDERTSIGNDPNPNYLQPLPGFFGSGALNLATHYNGFNHSRNEEVNIDDGSYSVTETWLVASGSDFENYSMSITSDNQNPFVNVSIQGKIKGLSTIVPSSIYFGGQYEDHKLIEDENKKDQRFLISPYMNALDKWYKISKSGVFGYTSDLYRRVNSTVAVELNSQPLEISLGMNEYAGEIDYSMSFDNRPTNIISGTLFENISVNETYPGDVYSVIPVIGRKTGPILQYNGSRTAYTRDLSVELTMDSYKIPYDTGRKMLIRRPSSIEPTASQIEKLIHELSPDKEPGVRKYFHDPPQESWNPKTGQYSFNIRWTYELDK